MFEMFQPGVLVKTKDGIGKIYRCDPTTCIVLIQDNDLLTPKMYRYAEVEIYEKPIESLV